MLYVVLSVFKNGEINNSLNYMKKLFTSATGVQLFITEV